MLTVEKKAHFKKLLNQRLEELLIETNETVGRMTDFANQSPDFLDRASIESHTTFAFRIKQRECVLIRKIEQALSRLEDGTFGVCEECSEEISEGRLQARPVATLCIQCKEKQETEEKIREWKERGDKFEAV